MSTSKSSSILSWTFAGIGLYLAGRFVYRALTKYQFNNKVVLITGGSRGLGLVLARKFADNGCKIVICSRSDDQLIKAKEELEKRGAEVLALSIDITDKRDVYRMINDVLRHFGTIDVLINNAGIIQAGPATAMTIKDYEDAMNTNFWGPLYCIYASLPHFIAKKSGMIVNITSIGGKLAIPHLLPYSASKFALTGFSEGLHAELKKSNIHVTTVVPNLMRTGSPRNAIVKGNHEAEYAVFKIADSSPLLSQNVDSAASRIVRAIEYRENEVILTMTAKTAVAFSGIAPELTGAFFTLINQLLPNNKPGGKVAKKGYEVESKSSKNRLTKVTDREAVRNNEL